MADPIKFESIAVSMSAGEDATAANPSPDTPFRMLILGDFSGRANRKKDAGGSGIQDRKIVAIDRDNDESVMEKMEAALRLDVGGGDGPEVKLEFAELDDFHPEQIYFRTDLFAKLRETRKKLLDPDTFEETAAKLSGRPATEKKPEKRIPEDKPDAQMPDVSKETSAGLLDQILASDTADSASEARQQPRSDWDRFLEKIVSPYLVVDHSREQDALVEGIDASIAALMGGILHHPDFQALEAAWRAVRLVVRRLETGETLKLYLLDVTRKELAADLTGSDDIRDTEIYKKLAAASRQSAGMAPWAAIGGMYTFEKSRPDAILLARLGALGQMLGAPFIGAADESLIGCEKIAATPDPADWNRTAAPEDEKVWQAIRSLPEAQWVGLVLPRFLVRLPYGENTDPVDAFDYEEMPGEPRHADYLWASPVFACMLVLGKTFTRRGWDFSVGIENDIDGLPLHTCRQAGETTVKPCAEVLFSDRALEKVQDRGVMALLSYREQDRVRLAGLRSIASPSAPIAARWW